MSRPDTTICQCWGGSTHGTDDPNVRRCDLCGGIVPADPATGDYLPRATTPVQSKTTGWQPINTAPRDGRRFLLWDGWQMCLASYDRGKYLATHGRSDHSERESVPELWHPLPEEPN